MAAAPAYQVGSHFKPLFKHTEHQQKQIPKSNNHPAVTYYTMLMKQGKDVGRACNAGAPELSSVETHSAYSAFDPTLIFHLYQLGLSHLQLADATFKLYRLIQVFLI